MIDTHFISKENHFLHLDSKKILSALLYILLASNQTKHLKQVSITNKTRIGVQCDKYNTILFNHLS